MLNEPIGEVLSQARADLGKSIKEVEFDTKIRAKHIEALEADDFDTLPGNVYTQGFIKTYANYLGIDPEPLIKSYRNRYLQPNEGDLLNLSSNIRVETKKRPAWFPFAVAAGFLAILFVTLLVWGIYAKNQSKETKVVVKTITGKQTLETAVAGATTSTDAIDDSENDSDTSSTETTEKNDAGSTTTTDKSGDEQTTTTTTDKNDNDKEQEKDGKVDVSVKLTGISGEGSWVKVYVDGEKKYEGEIAAGKSKLFSGDASVRVRVGNASGMEVMLDGKKISTEDLNVSNGIIDHTFKSDQNNKENNTDTNN